ncbi:hypothetical protein K432DRAFT_412803 [Lepidopterella palustris CBS 459.81]|uniref:Uncharacterized protein n=1 Tax=Lepidopterella palustris CBS 459.81 TaxID=1314670 RepID=A0A8E2JKL6_9PEZI|nr:hypothetical protein K432DRAFT_412803 [Lepidopterella palustris CBS 459.81]
MARDPTPGPLDTHVDGSQTTTNPNDGKAENATQHAVPIHPLSSMQGPFEESMLDVTGESGIAPFRTPNKNADLRHQVLCKINANAPEVEWNFTYNCYWRNNPKAKYHPLLKTLSQITFGIHLLHQHLEKSVSDVADILHKHVNEVDAFLKRTTEDIETSSKDMAFRRKCLKVPMEHVSEFDRLLEDRQYRAQLLEGNDTIERTIQRMSQMLNDYQIDIGAFKEANAELDLYLRRIGDEWTDGKQDVLRIYEAMCGNAQGWGGYLQTLSSKADKLGVVLVQVGSYCNEIEKRCGAASRRSLIASRSSSRNSNSRDAARSFRNSADNKPLPTVPSETTPTISLSPPRNDSATSNDQPEKRQSYLKREAKAAGKAGPPLIDPDHAESDTFTDNNTAELAKFIRNTGPPGSETTGPSSLPNGNGTKIEVNRPNSEDENLDGHKQREGKSYGRDWNGRPANTGPLQPKALENGVTALPPYKPPVLRGRTVANGEASPPLTAQDSAYSSVSAGSFGSPAAAHHAPPSPSLSHPRVTLGLFPSSVPTTPKFPPAHRNGSALSLSAFASKSSLSQHSRSKLRSRDSSTSRLLKTPSLLSLKKFFARKKPSQSALNNVEELNGN